MSKIQIGVACGSNCELYVNFLMKTIENTVSDKKRIEFILGINKPNVDRESLLKYKDVFNIKIIDALSNEHGSMGHGHCLDKILEQMSSEYGMIVDCDVAFLEKDWDVKLINELDDKKIIIGAATESNHHHYYNFPFTIMVLFKTKILKTLNVSFKPKLVDIILTEKNAKLFGREVGDKIHLDTAWQLPLKVKSAGYDGISLPLISPRYDHGRENMLFMKEGMRGEEHQLNGVPIFTHVGRSSTRLFSSDPIVIKWKKRVEEWLEEKR